MVRSRYANAKHLQGPSHETVIVKTYKDAMGEGLNVARSALARTPNNLVLSNVSLFRWIVNQSLPFSVLTFYQ
jgi:hypothetical protein